MSLMQNLLHLESRPQASRSSDDRSEFALPREFEPIELAGIGAFAEVWKALDTSSGRTCALKRLRPERRDDPVARRLLANELHACQSVDSRYLINVLRSELSAEVPYIVFEWENGRTLEEELVAGGPLPLRRALWIARQTAEGMSDLEAAGLAHGDIKPQNIFVTLGGEVKLLDLGFVRSIEAASRASAAEGWAGTPEYMAPESLLAAPAAPIAKDMYSLGVTLYRMLTGRLPFVGDSPADVMVHHRQTRPTLLRRYRPDAPRELTDLVARLLAKQPFRRPASLRGLIRTLVDLELSVLTTGLAEGA